MPSPFPGMDPYLEAPELWPDVHQSLALALREQLSPRLRPRYVAMVHHDIEVEMVEPKEDEPRTGRRRADVSVVDLGGPSSPGAGRAVAPAPLVLPLPEPREVKHFRIEVREAEGRRLVAVVEILARANKVPGRDRTAYEEKRTAYLESAAHFVEIDLLRVGERWRIGKAERLAAYRILVSRARSHRDAEVWPLALADPLPATPLPLLAPDPDVPMDLEAALARVYDGAGYDLIIDYAAPPPPPDLPDGEAAFVRERTAELLGTRRQEPSGGTGSGS